MPIDMPLFPLPYAYPYAYMYICVLMLTDMPCCCTYYTIALHALAAAAIFIYATVAMVPDHTYV